MLLAPKLASLAAPWDEIGTFSFHLGCDLAQIRRSVKKNTPQRKMNTFWYYLELKLALLGPKLTLFAVLAPMLSTLGALRGDFRSYFVCLGRDLAYNGRCLKTNTPSQENDHFFTPGSAQVSQDAPANAPKLIILGVTLANISSSGTNLAAFWLHLGCRFVDRVFPRRPGAAWTSKTIPQIHILKIFGTYFGSFLENVIECFLYRSFCCVRASFVSLCC